MENLVSKYFDIWSYKHLSYTLEIFRRILIGLYFSWDNLDFFLYTGITSASFKSLGNFEVEMEALIYFCTWNAKKFEFCFKILVWIPINFLWVKRFDCPFHFFSWDWRKTERVSQTAIFRFNRIYAWMVLIYLNYPWNSIFFKRTRFCREILDWLFLK